MKSFISSESNLPTILIVQDGNAKMEKMDLNSSILNLFSIVYLSASKNIAALSWIQENQPAIIILKVNYSDSPRSSLISELKLDWLTRNIPIVLMGSKLVLKSLTNLDFDARLATPYSTSDLERVVCSLVSTPTCQVYA